MLKSQKNFERYVKIRYSEIKTNLITDDDCWYASACSVPEVLRDCGADANAATGVSREFSLLYCCQNWDPKFKMI